MTMTLSVGPLIALVAGILIGTYSSIFVASPILVFWQNYVEKNSRSSKPAGNAPAVVATASKAVKSVK